MGIDWDSIIERNRLGLAAIVAALFAMAGWATPPAPGAAMLPRRLRLAMLSILRPAESAVRRLVIIAARGLAVDVPRLPPRRVPPAVPVLVLWRGRPVSPARIAALLASGASSPDASRVRPPVRSLPFPLLDPLKRFGPRRRSVPAHAVPRIIAFDRPFRGLPPPPGPDDPVDASRLALRLAAIAAALDDIDGHARRLAASQARAAMQRARDPAAPLTRRHLPPRRPGHPPGHAGRRRREVDAILADCDAFARAAEHDTS